MRLTGAVFIYHKLLTGKKGEIRDIYSGGILKKEMVVLSSFSFFPPTPAVGTSRHDFGCGIQILGNKIRMVVA